MAAATAPPPPTPQPAGFARWVPSLPTITLNQLNPFANGDDETGSNPKVSTDTKRPFLSTISFGSSAGANPPSPAPSNAEDVFPEPDSRSTSEADSREGSIAGAERRKKSNKPKTRYSICHPPPTSSTRQKLHRRPRSLLQLHRLVPSARPKPAFEVVPSANFSVKLTRATTKVFKAKHSLCPNDIVLLRAEKYNAGEEDEDEEARDVMGLICKGRKDDAAFHGGKAKMCMASGQEWDAYPLMNGGYEFFTTDEHGLGLTLRWVPKRNKDGSKPKNKRFNFSTISPTSRRHPVIASLSKTSLQINDVYRMPDPSAATPLSTPKATPKVGHRSALEEAMDDEEDGHGLCETDDHLREVITMTSIWVAFKEGWSPSFKYDEKDSVPASAANSIARSASLGISNSPSKGSASPPSTPPGSPAQQPLDKRNSMRSISSSIFRKSSVMSKSNRASQVLSPDETDEAPRKSDSSKSTGRARGDSNATVLVHRAASNRRKNNTHHAATWRPDLLDAQNPLSETSREHLSRTPSPMLQTQESIWDGPITPTHRRESVAQPLIPDDADASGASTPALDGRGSPAPDARKNKSATPPLSDRGRPRVPRADNSASEKRQSTLTDRSTSEAGPVKPKSGKAAGDGRRKGGWRRLWCGSSHDD